MSLSSFNHSTPHIAGLSHTGTVRTANEDAVSWWHESHANICFAVLADGMGGHKGGALASELCIDTIRSFVSSAIIDLENDVENDLEHHLNQDFELGLEQLKRIMAAASHAANEAIQQARIEQPDYKEMGTTLVFIAIWNGKLIVIHAGDSRCYLLSKESAESPAYIQLTRDDSVVQTMLDEGVITPEDVPNIPYRNRLTNALGIKSPLVYSLASHSMSENDALLICSDGFYQAVLIEDACKVVHDQGVTQQVVEQLINMSLDNQTDDNTSVILIGFDANTDIAQ